MRVVSPTTIVWPALLPPWKRTAQVDCSASWSMALPLPSSPHWAPSTTLAGTVAKGSAEGESMLWLKTGLIPDGFRVGSDYEWSAGRPVCMAQRHPEAERRLLDKWICMKCSATHRGSKPRACRKCGYTGFRKKAAERRKT